MPLPPSQKKKPHKVIDIRGTHGSGKSTLVRMLLEYHDWGTPILENGVHLGYHLPKIDCAVVARYTETGGGCDAIKTADEVVRRVKMFQANHKFTVFEGVLVSHTYERYAKLADEVGKPNYVFMFLDTPVNVCIQRVEQRRAAKGNLKPLDPKNVRKDHACDWFKLRPKFSSHGYTVKTIPYQNPLDTLLRELR